MRFQLVADNPAEEAALSAHPTVRLLFNPFLAVLQARSIVAATRLGVFDGIGHGERTADELSASLALDRDALELLLRVLFCAGYVASRGDRYVLTDLATSTLSADSPIQMAGWVRFNTLEWEVIGRLEDVLETGRGVGYRELLTDDLAWQTNQQAMLETARSAAQWVASQVPVPESPSKMLDMGGSVSQVAGPTPRL